MPFLTDRSEFLNTTLQKIRMAFPLRPRYHRLVGLTMALQAAGGISAQAGAQILTPDVTYNGPRPQAVHSTATEALINMSLEDQRAALRAMPITQVAQARYPKDSLIALSASRAEAWVKSLQATSVRGMQIDPYGVITVRAHEEPQAQREIASRLATSGLSLVDRAYALQMAVEGFSSAEYPERLPVAEQYLQQLDALGPAAALWQFNARRPLIYAYYRLGKRADVARVGVQAFNVVDQIPFELRGEESVFNPGISLVYGAVIDALSGQPNGRATIRAMNAKLMAATAAPPALAAADPLFQYFAEEDRQEMERQTKLADRVGEVGTPMIANYWANRGASRDSQSVAVNDGKIRVIEIGSFSCPGCVAAVPGMERLHQRFSAVEFNFLTFGVGVWGNRIVDPKVEADHLADHFINVLHATFPIGIAMASRHVPTDDGGEAAVITTPTWQAGNYPQTGKPTFYILDGHGVIRRVIAGYNRDLEENLATILEFLQKEASHS